ncbi:Hin recombinase [Burkholderia multivorans]|nr:Hin recombinase [Burkholderia multivorans]
MSSVRHALLHGASVASLARRFSTSRQTIMRIRDAALAQQQAQ